ncbi:MAG TPA: TIGR00730 family Rossman fold protein [Acidimicrobiia bacterium]|nr:TIGR00730 family Rossman fold protein [Acidimicrobiia bacterium]
MARLPRYRTGDAEIDEQIADLIAKLGDDVRDTDLLFELVVSTVRLARDHASRGDLKMANAALKEMRYAFAVFEPYRSARKAAIFGSARTRRDDPLYEQTVRLAEALAAADWMVITGAGPGIMEAGIEGAGAASSFGVGIRLPFEAATSQFLADDPKLVNFRYFFTRKVTFVKESHAFILLPGGFGTLDEAFELLTLVQTGKSQPAPIVLLDVPGGTYWLTWLEFVHRELRDRGYISAEDLDLVKITDDVDVALAEVTGFYRNFHSLRFVAGDLVLRIHEQPTEPELAALNDEFADIVSRGRIEIAEASPAEIADRDYPELPRLRFRFDRHGFARLRKLIDRLNAPEGLDGLRDRPAGL